MGRKTILDGLCPYALSTGGIDNGEDHALIAIETCIAVEQKLDAESPEQVV